MKLPKTAKGYLKLLIAIAEDRGDNLKGRYHVGEAYLIAYIRANIQNELGEKYSKKILKEFDLKHKE